jgi:hypothetical protein
MVNAISRHSSKVRPDEVSPPRTTICDGGFADLFEWGDYHLPQLTC